jgi:hypothetical protein
MMMVVVVVVCHSISHGNSFSFLATSNATLKMGYWVSYGELVQRILYLKL